MSGPDNAPHNALRHHVTGAIERGEAEPIVELSERCDNELADIVQTLRSERDAPA